MTGTKPAASTRLVGEAELVLVYLNTPLAVINQRRMARQADHSP